MRRTAFAVLGATLLAVPALAEPVQFSAIVRGELGYGTNPFLRTGGGVDKAVPFASIDFSPKLTKTTARSSTVLNGNYSRDQYFSRYGNTESFSAGLLRTDQWNEHVVTTAGLRYNTTNKALTYSNTDPSIGDPLNIGQRIKRFDGNVGVQYQLSAADSFNAGLNGSSVTYGGGKDAISTFSSDYKQYGANAGYNHAIDARTSVGLQGNVSIQDSDRYPRSVSYQPSLTGKRQLNAIWNIEGHLGIILQKVEGSNPRSTTSLGYGATLCAVYPRTHLCFTADQGSTPSGYGGLRKDMTVSASLTHDLTEHSHVTGRISYDDSRSNQVLTPSTIRKATSVRANADYSRDLSQRISAGFGGRYQQRETGQFGKAHQIAGTINVTAKLGRI